MIYSRFRYWAQTLHMPTEIAQAIDSDVQAMVWGRDVDFDPEELGTTLTNNRWISTKSQYLPKKEGGLGLLNWEAHSKALYQIIWHRYRDASEGDWKHLIVQWVERSSVEGLPN